MKKTLSILLLIIWLTTVTGCTKELIATNILTSHTIKTDEVTSKGLKENENKKSLTKKNTSSSTKSISPTANLLINRSNKLDKNYIPQSLTIPNVKFISYADPKVKKLNTTAASALESLFNAAQKDGITLLAVSGYRDYSYQEMLYNKKLASSGKIEADKYVAQPGESEHQTGIAMDLLSTETQSLTESFQNTEAYKWLENNAHKYGFIIRYPKDKESITGYSYEPWHIRYVGISQATEISQKHITLEEYLGSVK